VIYVLKTAIKVALGIDKAERNFRVFPDDTFIVSYPRSGSTWTRFLVANLVYPKEAVTFANIGRLIPDTAAQSRRSLKRVPRPRIIKSHQYFDPRYKRVIYVVRDPRDVALSYYDFQRKYRQIADGFPLEQYVQDFVTGRLGSWDWGTWLENVASWVATRAPSDNFLLLRYEDMIASPHREVSRLAAFLSVAVTPERLDEVVRSSSAARMRELEKLQSDIWVGTKNRREDIPFVRMANTGGWKAGLPVDSVRRIEKAWGSLMISLGYMLATSGKPENGDATCTPKSTTLESCTLPRS
jgi:Sulfotransferase domain